MRRLMIPAVFILAALSLAGCSSPNASSSAGHAPLVADSAPNIIGSKAQVGAAGDTAERKVIKSGSTTISVRNPTVAADKVSQIIESVGGRVDARTEHKVEDAGDVSAQLVVRIPSAKLTPTLDKIKKLGTVEDISISSDDVTSQSQDLDARISALRTSVDRLQTLMASASSTRDLITIESALSERQGNLEAMKAQKRALQSQVDLSSVTVQLDSPAMARSHLPGNFFDGIVIGWNALVGFFAGLIIVVGVLLPWLILAGALATGVIALVRWRRKRRSRVPE